jgi:hypothetical protein
MEAKMKKTDNNKLPLMNFDQLPLMLNEREAAKVLNVSTAFLRLSRAEGEKNGRTAGPKYIKLNGSVKYKTEELKHWVESLPEKNCSEKQGMAKNNGR